MRILLVGPSLFMPWTDYTAHALGRLGQSVKIFYSTSLTVDRLTLRKGRRLSTLVPGLRHYLDRWRDRWHQNRDHRLLQESRTWKPDLILVLWGTSLSADLLKAVKEQTQCPLVTWWVDDPFRYRVRELLPLYDVFFTFDRSYMGPLRSGGARDVRFLPCACDETAYRPSPLSPLERRLYGSEIALVAWYYPDRVPVLQALRGFDLKIWGKGWASPEARRRLDGIHRNVVQGERFLSDHQAAQIYRGTKIGLNIHSFQTCHAGLNTRSFELLATGTFQLVDAVTGMEELLEPGRDLVVYHSPEEARDLACFYLSHPEERTRIAAQGRERALREHTYVHRMRTLLKATAPL